MQTQVTPPAYLMTPHPQLWNVADAGDAFVWDDSQATIALARQLSLICQLLSAQLGGLPSLTVILFVIDALSRPWDEPLARQRVELLTQYTKVGTPQHSDTEKIVSWLVQLGQLDAELRQGIDQHSAILADSLHGLPERQLQVNALEATDAIAWLDLAAIDRDISVFCANEVIAGECVSTIQTLEFMANSGATSDVVRLRQRTGLSVVPTVETDLELPADPYTNLLRSLSEDAELGGVANLAIATASTLALPRQPSDPDLLPIGGVSDITNRGHPEKLLMTELAADPDLLLARIINSQALYLRRESPPAQRPMQRQILIENGVRAWGTTRVRATAFALAVAASEERRGGCQLQVLTVAGARHWADDLSQREGLVNQLARLEPDAHPGEAIAKVLNPDDSGDQEELAEPLLILTANTQRDPQFTSCLQDVPRPYLIAAIDLQGQVSLMRRTLSGDEVLHQQQMEWVEPTREVKVTSAELPLFLRQEAPPLRFSVDPTKQWSQASEGPALWTVSHDRRLVCFDTHQVGAREVATLPSTHVLASQAVGSGVELVVEETVRGSQQKRYFLVRAYGYGVDHVLELKRQEEDSGPVTYAFDGENLISVGRLVTFFDTMSGKELACCDTPSTHLGGPFFGHESVLVASYEQGSIRMRQIGRLQKPAGVVVRSATGTPVAYSCDLSTMSILHGDHVTIRKTDHEISARTPFQIVSHSIDKSSIVVGVNADVFKPHRIKDMNDLKHFRLNLADSQVSQIYHDSLATRYPTLGRLVETQSVRSRLSGICVGQSAIFLKRNSSKFFRLQFEQRPARLTLGFAGVPKDIVSGAEFGDESKDAEQRFPCGWKLRHARLTGGDAWLDSRGLLHLRAHDGTELSLVLHDKHLAGWHSDGEVFGPNYFTNQSQSTPVPLSVIAWLKEFVAQCSL